MSICFVNNIDFLFLFLCFCSGARVGARARRQRRRARHNARLRTSQLVGAQTTHRQVRELCCIVSKKRKPMLMSHRLVADTVFAIRCSSHRCRRRRRRKFSATTSASRCVDCRRRLIVTLSISLFLFRCSPILRTFTLVASWYVFDYKTFFFTFSFCFQAGEFAVVNEHLLKDR